MPTYCLINYVQYISNGNGDKLLEQMNTHMEKLFLQIYFPAGHQHVFLSFFKFYFLENIFEVHFGQLYSNCND